MDSCHAVDMPMEDCTMFESKDYSSTVPSSNDTYCSCPCWAAIGSRMDLIIWTASDLALGMRKTLQLGESSSSSHWNAVTWILRYFKGTPGPEIWFSGPDLLNVLKLNELDWARDLKDGISSRASLFKMAEGAITWYSRNQTVVTTSTCEANYICLSSAFKEAL